MNRRWLAAALLGLVGMLATACPAPHENIYIRNQTEDYVLFRAEWESFGCKGSMDRANADWVVLEPNSRRTPHYIPESADCIVVTNLTRTNPVIVPLEGGGDYVLVSTGNGLGVTRGSTERGQRTEETQPRSEQSANALSPENRRAAPETLLIIGLPAALSAVYLGWVAASLAGSFFGGARRRNGEQPDA